MGIDVADIGRLGARVAKRPAHGERRARSLRVRRGDVVGVVGGAVARDLRVDAGTPRLRMRLGLEDHRRASLGQDEAVAVRVEGPRGGLGVGVLRQRRHLREGGHRQWVRGGLRATDDAQVEIAVADQAHALADRVVGGSARRQRRHVVAGEAVAHRQVPGRGVGHQHRHHERRHAARALLQQHRCAAGASSGCRRCRWRRSRRRVRRRPRACRRRPRRASPRRSRTARSGRCDGPPSCPGSRSRRSRGPHRRGSRGGRRCRTA